MEGGAHAVDPRRGGAADHVGGAGEHHRPGRARTHRQGGTGWTGLRRIGIDEKSWGKGQGKYLVIVTDHDTGRVAWIGEGRCQATVEAFFDDLGEERARALTHVSADGADWIHPVVRAKAPQAGCAWMRSMSSSGPGRSWTSCAAASPGNCAPPGAATRPPPSAPACGHCAKTSRS